MLDGKWRTEALEKISIIILLVLAFTVSLSCKVVCICRLYVSALFGGGRGALVI